MAEYIRRETLVHRLKSPYLFNITPRIFEIISEIPAADVAPVVHGRWMKRRNGGTLCSRCGHYTQYKGQVLDMSEAIACPWCGAMMDGERKDGGDSDEAD